MSLLVILGSIFFSLGLSKSIVYLVNKLVPINLFSTGQSGIIPGFTQSLAQAKSTDMAEFYVFVLVAFLLLIGNLIITKYKRTAVFDIIYFATSLIFYLQTNFVGFSGKLVLIFFAIFQTLFWLNSVLKIKYNKIVWNDRLFVNGLLLGLVLMQFVSKWNYSLLLPWFTLLFFPFLYHVLAWRFLKNPCHIFLSLFIFFHGNFLLMVVLLVIFVLIVTITEKMRLEKTNNFFDILFKLYPYMLIIIVAFNPLYYWSSLDTVEEGFWLGWLYRLLNGQDLYKDVLVYHPPLIVWGLKSFVSVFGATVANTKLFFHILQILAYCIFYAVIKNIIANEKGRVIILLMVMSLGTNLVKNNVEIRVAMGLLAILPLISYFKNRKIIFVFLSGILSGLSLFTSVEVGAVVLVSVSAFLLLNIKEHKSILKIFAYLAGVGVVSFVILLILSGQGALGGIWEQLSFYTRVFSEGYFNVVAPRSNLLPLLDWRQIDIFWGSVGWWWQFSEALIILSLFLSVKRYFWSKENKNKSKDGAAVILSFFALLVFRTALGRSDLHHLLFPLMIALILLGYLVEIYFKKPTFIFIFLFVLFFTSLNRDNFNKLFVYGQVEKLQSYGRIPGTYIQFKSPKYGLAIDQGENISDTNNLLDYLSKTDPQQKIFAYPWMPEIYFLSERQNATSDDTPCSFFTEKYQARKIEELLKVKDVLIIYNKDFGFGSCSVDSLKTLNSFIQDNYSPIDQFGKIKVLQLKNTIKTK